MSHDDPRLQELLAATARGDRAAFSELYAATSAHLFALLLRILRRRDLAEEALQDCYVRIWQKSGSYSAERGAPVAWLASIARYRALDMLRARRPEVSEQQNESGEPPATHVDEGIDVQRQAEDQHELERLHDCLAELGGEQRSAVMLAYYEGFTHPELAERMTAPLGTVKSWVRRGLQRLRECLEQ
ncbi:sigma-70 family RNA polymerase sigma factor [Algiphilus aromaticivorans]|uniref:sigma-70 family RNA polymerase sigma factor n=1 Tax=Algiphilus aromaticivorans TaxID=382454 RepID=UPI0005C12A04|nr:sigma-70 family RNA polymerase sigma factor [Algiphilus aromaticivorans]